MRKRKPTIAELREMEIEKLARFKTENPSESDYKEARRIMNSFYRLCGLDERILYLENDSRTHDSKYTKECEERAERWRNRLNSKFKEIYGLEIVYCGYLPSIGVTHSPGGGFSEKITRWFYSR